jgi:hypothetical protein
VYNILISLLLMEIIIMPSYKPYSLQQNGSETTGSYWTGTSTKNKGGAVINVGSTTTLAKNLALGTANLGAFGSRVVQDTITSGDYAAVASSGSPNFAYNNQKPIAMRYTTTIAGTGNTVLQPGADTPSLFRSIHRQEVVRSRRLTTAIRAGYWNIYSGQFSTAPTVAVDNTWSNAANATTATSSDDAARPSRTAPGEFTVKLGQQVPVNSGYKPKNG